MITRREFVETLAGATGAVVLLPSVTACTKTTTPGLNSEAPSLTTAPEPRDFDLTDPPLARPEPWDPVAFNKTRGNAGAIPTTYLKDVNGAEGDHKHLGKHLPYRPAVDAKLVPNGYLAIMWGDPQKGHAQHPNAARAPTNNNEGHWYNWIKVRKAMNGDVEELQSAYSEWPVIGPGDNGKYVAVPGKDIAADGGIHTIYLVALPKDVAPGDTVRIWAHCLTHGEYVDFLTV